MTTYDEWKTTNPADFEIELGECDCCARMRPLTQCWLHGNMETWACDECRGVDDPDAKNDARRDDALWEQHLDWED